ncbi:MAG: peptidylprolyl isomerase [Ferruginibacter sp.]
MKKRLVLSVFICMLFSAAQAQTTAQIKKELEATPDPIGYVKTKIKKRYKIDTITVMSTSGFLGIADSIAYHGKIGKVYGPFKKENILIKVLGKVPNTFYHVSHILLDTSVYRKKFADSLADVIIEKIRSGRSDFEMQAKVYSADMASAVKGGDLGWFIRGVMLPQMDRELARHKKNELFKVWSPAGLHIVKLTDNPKKDDGFALLLRVFL